MIDINETMKYDVLRDIKVLPGLIYRERVKVKECV